MHQENVDNDTPRQLLKKFMQTGGQQQDIFPDFLFVEYKMAVVQ